MEEDILGKKICIACSEYIKDCLTMNKLIIFFGVFISICPDLYADEIDNESSYFGIAASYGYKDDKDNGVYYGEYSTYGVFYRNNKSKYFIGYLDDKAKCIDKTTRFMYSRYFNVSKYEFILGVEYSREESKHLPDCPEEIGAPIHLPLPYIGVRYDFLKTKKILLGVDFLILIDRAEVVFDVGF